MVPVLCGSGLAALAFLRAGASENPAGLMPPPENGDWDWWRNLNRTPLTSSDDPFAAAMIRSAAARRNLWIVYQCGSKPEGCSDSRDWMRNFGDRRRGEFRENTFSRLFRRRFHGFSSRSVKCQMSPVGSASTRGSPINQNLRPCVKTTALRLMVGRHDSDAGGNVSGGVVSIDTEHDPKISGTTCQSQSDLRIARKTQTDPPGGDSANGKYSGNSTFPIRTALESFSPIHGNVSFQWNDAPHETDEVLCSVRTPESLDLCRILRPHPNGIRL
jgi:hypothetical protein